MKFFKNNTKILNQYNRHLFPLLFIGLFVLVSVFSLIKTVEAGFVSSVIGGLFGGEQASAKIVQNNKESSSQTMTLPVVAVNVDPNPDRSFDVIPVSGGGTLVADLASDNTAEEYSSKISVYIVREGDTFSSIGKMFNVSVNTILWANNLNSKSSLSVGQSLVILPVSGIKYSVQKNDTIITIAQKFKADVMEIYNYNDLDENSKLTVGQSIIIPDAEISSVSKVPVIRALNGMPVPYDPLIVNVKKLPFYPGYYSCPVQGTLTQGLHGRNSVDLAAPIGTPIYASAKGVVTISKTNGTWNGGYGNFVVISHDNNTQTLYGHMQKTIVLPGAVVDKGQVIGYIGVSGMTTGPHVHFEIRGARNPFDTQKCK